MKKEELLEVLKTAYEKKFKPPEHSSDQETYEKQLRIANTKPYVDKFYVYIEEEFVYVINGVYDLEKLDGENFHYDMDTWGYTKIIS